MDATVLVYTMQHHRYVTLSYLLYDFKVSNRPAFSRYLMLLQQFETSGTATDVLLQVTMMVSGAPQGMLLFARLSCLQKDPCVSANTCTYLVW